jgi:hypothetical protein
LRANNPESIGAWQGRTAVGKFEAEQPIVKAQQERTFELVKRYRDAGYSPEQAADAALNRPVQFAPVHPAGPGVKLFDATGKFVGQGGPKFESIAPGAQGILIGPEAGSTPPTTQWPSQTLFKGGSPQPMQSTPGVTTIPGPPPILTAEETRALSAAQRVAKEAGIKFDPTVNPKNPYSQLPLELHAKVNAIIAEEKMDPEMREQRLNSAATLEALRQGSLQMQHFHRMLAEQARGDRSYQFAQKELDTVSKPLMERVDRISRLQDTIAQGNMLTDALIGPELLTVMAGGQGSGMRMNEAELKRIFGSTGAWGQIERKLRYFDPSKPRAFTAQQQRQIRELVTAVADKAKRKMDILNGASRDILGSSDPADHRKIVADAKRALVEEDIGGRMAPTPVTGGVPKVGETFQGGKVTGVKRIK